MTTPDSRPVLDVIADVLAEHTSKVGFDGRDGTIHQVECLSCEMRLEPTLRAFHEHIAAAVLAACQGATVEQQAELTNAEVEWSVCDPGYEPNVKFTSREAAAEEALIADFALVARLVGPWREDPS